MDKFDFLYKHQSFLQADTIFFVSHIQVYQKYPEWQVYNIFAISREKREWFNITYITFCVQMDIQFSYKLRPSILMGMARHAWSIQKKKFAKSLQYIKNEVRNEVCFLCREISSLLQLASIILDGLCKLCLSYSK